MRPYAFEAIGEDLDLMPMSARRAADAAGLRPSLQAWRGLPLEARALLCRLGEPAAVDVAQVATVLSRIEPPIEVIERVAEPPSDAPPETLVSALGAAKPLTAAVWSALTALERYALVKVARKGASERLDRAYDEIVGISAAASHLDATGAARMVSVSPKAASQRRALASSRVSMNELAFERLHQADAPKGDVLGTARIAGIMAAKRTSELVPLCHPLSLTRVDIHLELVAAERCVNIRAAVEAVDRTGVEMEALTAASVAALTVYDMLKAFDRTMSIGPTRLEEKSGGRHDFRRDANATARFALSDAAPLSAEAALSLVARPDAGASVLFVGMVRDHNAGLSVSELEYQAYAGMAVKELERVALEIEAEIPAVRLAALHRTGRLSVGDIAVICAASAPHRDAAFRAARLLIDRVKERVPVWKREHSAEGPYWVGWEDARVQPDGSPRS
jgi:molybdopterin synthase catalytic subunit